MKIVRREDLAMYWTAWKVLRILNPNVVRRTMEIAINVQHNMIGRYAGRGMDKLAHLLPVWLSASSVADVSEYAHVEIGTLFGGGLIAKLKILQEVRRAGHYVIAIDPLEGYYGAENDPDTGLPVNEVIVRENISKLECAQNNFYLVKCFSTDPEAVASLGPYKVLSLLIDGDHSYHVVQNDWQAYSPLVLSGGYVIFDDYANPNWPGVGQFVNELISEGLEDWRVCGVIGNALILRKM